MASNFVFYYFGDDEAYYRTLVGEFGKNTRMIIDFRKEFESDEKKIQSFFIKIFRERPTCIFIDFSKNTQDYLHLARIISRIQTDNKLVTVGLVDYLSPPEVMGESIATGVTLTHIKSAETYDVIFDVARLVAPQEIGEHGFAKATLKDEYEAGVPAKIGYINNDGLHIETDHHLQKGDRVRINHHWTTNRIVPSREVFVQEVSTKNLFYHFKYAVDLEFLFVDEFLPPEGMDLAVIDEKKAEREELIRYYRKQLSRWITDNETRSFEKKAKVLVVDRQFHFYDNQPRTDRHAYTIRCVPYLTDVGVELDRLEPQVIAFALEPDTEPENKNTNERLVQLMRVLKGKYQENAPFVVVFNCKTPSKEFQDTFLYPHVMTTDAELSVDVLVKMAEIFDKKISKNIMPSAKDSKVKVFLKKSNAASLTEIIIPITVVKLSESDMIFQCEREIPIGTNLHLRKPVDMYVHVQPTKNQGKVPEYHGLIHCLGEEAKQELRKFVNSVFFREHDEKKEAEVTEFNKLNEKKLQEKQEILKKQLEAQEAKAKEEAEKPAEEPKKVAEPS